jgi:hypothetical protein
MNTIILIIILIIVYVVFFKQRYEHFYDIIPYNIVWGIDKCLEGNCVIKKSYDCYKYCQTIQDDIAKQKCEVECLNIGDEMFDYLKYQNYNWPLKSTNIHFRNYSLLNDTNDYVNIDIGRDK